MEIQRKRVIRVCFGLITSLSINMAAFGQPDAPGFVIEDYAQVQQPDKLAFSPGGILYVGTHRSSARIYRIGIGGSPIEEYGDTLLGGPDAVVFDAGGAISGVAGSVLVGDVGDLVAILPDETTVPLLSIPGNISHLVFDRATRLLMNDTDGFKLWATTGEPPLQLGDGFDGLTVDGANRIYSSFVSGQVQVREPNGTRLPDLLPPDDLGIFDGLAFGPFDPIWKGELFASARSTVYRIGPDGSLEVFATGFVDTSDAEFGPDGALYVVDSAVDTIYRISPNGIQNVTVYIDIKPGSNKNPVNPKSKGKLKVAIITTDEFDASTVDADSVLFGPGEAKPVWYRLDDVDHDGDLDLALKFNIKETGIACGDTEATLIGETFDGVQITGTDSIKTVGCGANKLTYTYRGNSFEEVDGLIFTTNDRVTAQFTIDCAVAHSEGNCTNLPYDNYLQLGAIELEPLSFLAGPAGLPTSDGEVEIAQFSFSTDSRGRIVDWDMDLFLFDPSGVINVDTDNRIGGPIDSAAALGGGAAVRDNPGEWRVEKAIRHKVKDKNKDKQKKDKKDKIKK